MTHVYAFSTFTNARNSRSFVISILLMIVLLAVLPAQAAAAVPDPVLEWIEIMNDAVLAGGTNPLVSTRVVALVSGSVFDAVNGIAGRYTPLHVVRNGPAGASQRAAAVQAAYAMLVKIYPAQISTLTAQRNASINAIKALEDAAAVRAGIDWGQRVAYDIWQWRLNDGLAPNPPPFLGVASIVGTPTAVGAWRPTPLANAPGAGPQFATMAPWVLSRPGQFRLPPPWPLDSPQFAADLSEIRMMGSFSGSGRSSDQSELALFWAGNTPLYWNRIAVQIMKQRSLSLVQEARLFARLNVSMADAAIACWDSKYRYVFWRPITAIRDSATANPDPAWVPWLDFFPAGTPPHPEYPSGHSTVSGAAASTLARVFGDDVAFTVTSEVRPGTRSFASFSAAVAEIADARVFGGIHFRTSCVRGNTLGRTVANYVATHSMK
jgi:hypothetical protein